MSDVTPIFLVLLLGIGIYFAWMDVALYYKLQSQPQNLLLTQNYDLAKLKLSNKTTTPSPKPFMPFDAFNPISLKLLMLDHANHYVYYPLGKFFWL